MYTQWSRLFIPASLKLPARASLCFARSSGGAETAAAGTLAIYAVDELCRILLAKHAMEKEQAA